MWKWAILGSPDPPKPLQGPPDPTGGPGRPKMAKINIIQSTGDNLGQQIIFGGCQFFFSFFTRNDPFPNFLSDPYQGYDPEEAILVDVVVLVSVRSNS